MFGRNHSAPKDMGRIPQVLKRHTFLLIADEVVCGFAAGHSIRFAAPMASARPSSRSARGLPTASAAFRPLVVRGLGCSAAGFPISNGPFRHGYTFSAHPVGAAAALAKLDILDTRASGAARADLGPSCIGTAPEHFLRRPYVAEVLGAGLLGRQFAQDPSSRANASSGRHVGAAGSPVWLGRHRTGLPTGTYLGSRAIDRFGDEHRDIVRRVHARVEAGDEDCKRLFLPRTFHRFPQLTTFCPAGCSH